MPRLAPFTISATVVAVVVTGSYLFHLLEFQKAVILMLLAVVLGVLGVKET